MRIVYLTIEVLDDSKYMFKFKHKDQEDTFVISESERGDDVEMLFYILGRNDHHIYKENLKKKINVNFDCYLITAVFDAIDVMGDPIFKDR